MRSSSACVYVIYIYFSYSHSRISAMNRGAFIVLEGCDRAGKSTQAKMLSEELRKFNVPTKNFAFPNRSSETGRRINNYLKGIENISDEGIHTLFSDNRKELAKEMRELLLSGTTLIVDRYSFSGVAFSAAKPNMNEDWCWAQERGLPKPDLVLFLELPLEKAARRNGYGDEQYENYDFQMKVLKNYNKMMDPTWRVINADRDMKTVNKALLKHIQRALRDVKDKPLQKF